MLHRLRRVLYRVRKLKLWQRTLLIAVLIGLVVGLPVACGGSDDDSAGASGESQTELYTVQYGDLTSTIYSSGSLVYSTSEQLTFGSAGTVAALYIEKNDIVVEGEVLARLDSESIESLEAAVAKARINHRDAVDALEDAQNPYDQSDIDYAQQAVEQAQIQLHDAQERGAIQIANAEYALDQAFQSRNDSLALYMNGQISSDDYMQVVRDWEIKELDLEIARVNVDKSISDAEKKLEDAEDNLAEVLGGADPLVVELKQAELDSAQAALNDALEQLASAKDGYPIEAPFNGVVAQVNVEPGEEVNANTVVIEIIDPSAFDMSAKVDEIDVAQLRLGQEATVTLDALPDLELTGNVSSISAFAQSQSGVVSYPINISLDTSEDVQLLEGMSATATIEIKLAGNALLVPSSAVQGGAGSRAMLMVMVDGQPEPRMVTLGATDGVQTEVLTGLDEGDEVIVEVGTVSPASEDSQGGIQQPEGFEPPEGFMPGGGGGFFIRQ